MRSSRMKGSQARRPAGDDRQHLAVAENPLGGAADVGLGHRSDQGIAVADIVDPEPLEKMAATVGPGRGWEDWGAGWSSWT